MPAPTRQPECAEARLGYPDKDTRETPVGEALQLALDEHRRQAEADARFDQATGEGRR